MSGFVGYVTGPTKRTALVRNLISCSFSKA
ncbi:protein of unknown function [Azospirillum baldaniorum]|uniref:Uncharacterized protein n=1 Tax=Azospirillum baldaniorum TaxID=1064539 RepID=A0A9P1JPY2_9PROT|nr:protein of unknown function [Azospirillum baldaniorum]